MSLEDIAWDSVNPMLNFDAMLERIVQHQSRQRAQEIEAATIAGFIGACNIIFDWIKREEGIEFALDMKREINELYPNIHWD